MRRFTKFLTLLTLLLTAATTSAWADEDSEVIDTNEEQSTYTGTYFKVECQDVGNGNGFKINKNATATISPADEDDAKTITKVELTVGYGNNTAKGKTESSEGTVSVNGSTITISDFESDVTSLTLSNSNTGGINISSVTVYYDPDSGGGGGDTRIATTVTLSGGYATTGAAGTTIALPTATVTDENGNNLGTNVEWDSSDENVAVINGASINLLAEGTTTIRARYFATDTYKEGTATYTLTVTAAAPAIPTITLAGTGDGNWLNGVSWDPTANEMTYTDGTYSITFNDVAAGTYEFKFCVDKSWAETYGGSETALNTTATASSNGGNISFTLTAASDVTITFNYTDKTFMIAVPTPASATYTVTLADGTEDAANWTIAPTEAAEGAKVTATYTGTKKVKSVGAKSAVGPEESETITTTDGIMNNGEHFRVMENVMRVGFYGSDGLMIGQADGKEGSVTITSRSGEIITKIELTYGSGDGYASQTASTAGTVSSDGMTITDINATSVTISNSASDWVFVKTWTIYYIAPTKFTLTPNDDKTVWTLDEMPAGNLELQVEYLKDAGLEWTYNDEAMPEEGVTAYRGFEQLVLGKVNWEVGSTKLYNAIEASLETEEPLISFSSSNESVVKFADASDFSSVEFVGAGTTVITLTFKGNDDYAEESITLPVTIKEPITLTLASNNSEWGTVELDLGSSSGPVTYTELKGGEVLHVGDVLKPTGDVYWIFGEGYRSEFLYSEDAPFKLIRANITSRGWFGSTVTPAEDGEYYVLQFVDSYANEESYITFNKDLTVTDASDGISVTFEASGYDEDEDCTVYQYTSAVHEVGNNIIANTDGTYSVIPNTEVTVKATPADGYQLASWSNDAEVTDDGTQTLTVGEEDITLTATFATNSFGITVPAKGYTTYISSEDVTLVTTDQAALYSVASVSGHEVTLTEALTAAPAGTPLLIWNGADEERQIELAPTDDAEAVTVAPEFKGTLEAKTFTDDDMAAADHYVLTTSNDFVWVRSAGTLAAGKCWIELPKQGAAGARSLRIVAGGTTGIGLTPARGAEGSGYYTLDGRRVTAPTKKGVYVRNGRKVVVK